jgi:hypothetical protein
VQVGNQTGLKPKVFLFKNNSVLSQQLVPHKESLQGRFFSVTQRTYAKTQRDKFGESPEALPFLPQSEV